MDLYIFRHGDTVDTDESKLKIIIRGLGRKNDTRSLQVLPKGIPALEKIGSYLTNIKTDSNFCSPYLRCVNSSDIVGKIAIKKYLPDERIRELEINGEKFSSFYSRVKSFLDELKSKKFSAVSICTHGAVIAAIKHMMTGNFYFFQVLDYPPPGNLLIIKDGTVSQINFNR